MFTFHSNMLLIEELRSDAFVLPVHGIYSGSAAAFSEALYMEAFVSLY